MKVFIKMAVSFLALRRRGTSSMPSVPGDIHAHKSCVRGQAIVSRPTSRQFVSAGEVVVGIRIFIVVCRGVERCRAENGTEVTDRATLEV